jgi:16S rRNA processing protein RimM
MTAPDRVKVRGLIAYGRIVGAHGLRGAVRLRPNNPESNPDLIQRIFIDREGTPVEHRVRSCARAGHGSIKWEIEGIDSIEQAQALRGADVYIAVKDLPAAEEKEFYYFQVIGLRVETTDGRLLGVIDEVFFNGANDVWVVRDGNGEVLIPVIEDVVQRIDVEGGRAVIEAIPGLLD